MKIAVVGDAISTRHLAPFADPSWEIWGAGNGYAHLKRATRYFELHGWSDVAATVKADKTVRTDGGLDTNFWNAPLQLGCSHVYTGREIPDKFGKRGDGSPHVEQFPFDRMLSLYPPYFTSTFSWLLAFAITLEPEEIAFYGFDLSIDEYVSQKAAIEFFTGIAWGRGVKISIAPRSMLLRTPFLYALETAANRRSRSILMDQRYVIEKELERRKLEIDHAFYARLGAVNRVDEHKAVCTVCKPGAPCERFGLIRADFGTAVAKEAQADIDFGQIRARLDENTYYLHHLVIDDAFGPDQVKEDKALPVLARPPIDKYEGLEHIFPLPKELAANVRSDGSVDYEIKDGPSITEVTGLLVAKDGM